jgi:hypothetical protein
MLTKMRNNQGQILPLIAACMGMGKPTMPTELQKLNFYEKMLIQVNPNVLV